MRRAREQITVSASAPVYSALSRGFLFELLPFPRGQLRLLKCHGYLEPLALCVLFFARRKGWVVTRQQQLLAGCTRTELPALGARDTDGNR